jgi:hypothetical protein
MNKVVNVNLTGGIIGLLANSPQSILNDVIKKENDEGWYVVQIIPAASGNIFLFILRFLILICTLFLFTPVNGYYIIMEDRSSAENTSGKPSSTNKTNEISRNQPPKVLTIYDRLSDQEKNIYNSLSDQEKKEVDSFITYGLKNGDKLVINEKSRKIDRFDEKEWSKILKNSEQNEWVIISEK